MTDTRKAALAGIITSIIFASLFTAQAAETLAPSSTDLLVRYRAPQNTALDAQVSTRILGVTDSKAAQIVNGEEGVVKLTFASGEEALRAQKRLELSDEVVNVAPNLLYHTALNVSLPQQVSSAFEGMTADEQDHYKIRSVFERLFNVTGGSAPIPGVQVPTTEFKAGVDPLDARDWAMSRINIPSISEVGYLLGAQKQPVVTAVIDTGVDYNHEDLIGAMWRKGNDPYEVGYDFAHNNAQPYDAKHFDLKGCLANQECAGGVNQNQFLVNPGHGTHCAGHVGAVANNSLGIRGVATNTTQVMALKFFYDYGEKNAGHGDDRAAIQSIDYAIKQGAKVISASWGGRQMSFQAEKSELKQAILRAKAAGVLFVVAAGNDGINQDKDSLPVFPAKYDIDNMIVVAAMDQDDQIAKFSNYGGQSVHIGAPGVKILSTTVGSLYSDLVGSVETPKGVVDIGWDGTSMATPIVAGAAALIWAAHPDEDYRQIRARILNNVRSVPALAGKVTTGGVLDVAAAIR